MTTMDSVELTISEQQRKELTKELLKQNIKEWTCENKDLKHPENAFMIAKKKAQIWFKNQNIPINMRTLCRLMGQIWQELPDETKKYYRSRSEIFYQQRLSFRENNPNVPLGKKIVIKEIENYNLNNRDQQKYIKQEYSEVEPIVSETETEINNNSIQQQREAVNYNLQQINLTPEQISYWNHYWQFWNLSNQQSYQNDWQLYD